MNCNDPSLSNILTRQIVPFKVSKKTRQQYQDQAAFEANPKRIVSGA